MQFLLKHKTVILRVLGLVMLIVGFAIHFWAMPKEGYTKEQIAAANVARMEANIIGSAAKSSKAAEKDTTKFLEELKNTQEQQMRYLTIIAMILGIAFLAYSFIKTDKES